LLLCYARQRTCRGRYVPAVAGPKAGEEIDQANNSTIKNLLREKYYKNRFTKEGQRTYDLRRISDNFLILSNSFGRLTIRNKVLFDGLLSVTVYFLGDTYIRMDIVVGHG